MMNRIKSIQWLALVLALSSCNVLGRQSDSNGVSATPPPAPGSLIFAQESTKKPAPAPSPVPAPTGLYTSLTGGLCAGAGDGAWLDTTGFELFNGDHGSECETIQELGIAFKVQMNITSYSTETQLQALATAAQTSAQAFYTTLDSMNQGTVTIGQLTFPINGAVGQQIGSRSYIALFSAQPYTLPSNSYVSGTATTGDVIVFESDGNFAAAGAMVAGAGGYVVNPDQSWIYFVGGIAGVQLLPVAQSGGGTTSGGGTAQSSPTE